MMFAALLLIGTGRTAQSFSKQYRTARAEVRGEMANVLTATFTIRSRSQKKRRQPSWPRSKHASVEIVFVLLRAKKVLDYSRPS
jgi:hypothetical protein